MTGAINILFVDDHRLFRKGVIAALKALRSQWLFREAENGQEAVDIVSRERSLQLVLLDVSMPVMDGIEAVRRIKQLNPDLPIIMLTQFDETSLILHFLQLGINGYLIKNVDPEEVVEAIEKVTQSGKYITSLLMQAVEASIGIVPENRVCLNLTARDFDILNRLSRGMNTKEIASNLHLTETSIESYRKELLLHKTHTHNVPN